MPKLVTVDGVEEILTEENVIAIHRIPRQYRQRDSFVNESVSFQHRHRLSYRTTRPAKDSTDIPNRA